MSSLAFHGRPVNGLPRSVALTIRNDCQEVRQHVQHSELRHD